MVTEDYVSFDTAKLLKEKGFNDVPVYTYYLSYGGFYLSPMAVTNKQLYAQGHIAAPTLQMAMKWLREVYNLEIYPYHNNPTIYNSKWWIEIIEYPNSVSEYESGKDEEFDTYEEACEAGIKYCLENLI